MINLLNQDELEIETVDFDKVLEDGINLNIDFNKLKLNIENNKSDTDNKNQTKPNNNKN